MNRSRVTIRYARALLEMAREQSVLDQIDQDIRMILEILSTNKSFNAYIRLPKLPSYEKHKKVSSLLDPYLQTLTKRFIRMVFNNGREHFLADICRNFIEMSKQARNIVSADLVLAQELTPHINDEIIKTFEEKLHSTVEMEVKTDPGIIGGFIFTLNGWQYDASIASALKTIQKQLQAE